MNFAGMQGANLMANQPPKINAMDEIELGLEFKNELLALLKKHLPYDLQKGTSPSITIENEYFCIQLEPAIG